MHNHGSHMKLMLWAIGGFVVLGALGVPVLSYAPLLILLLCPLMMMFMMGGMGHGGHSSNDDSGDRYDDRPAAHRH